MPGTSPGMTSGESTAQHRGRSVLDTRFRGYDDLLWFDACSILKDNESVNPLETILGDQWANPFGVGNAHALP
jgi:hypothetical protein